MQLFWVLFMFVMIHTMKFWRLYFQGKNYITMNLFWKEKLKVAMMKALKEGLCLWYVLGRQEHDALGRLREVAEQGPLNHQFVKIMKDSLEGHACPSVIHIQGLGDSGIGLPQ